MAHGSGLASQRETGAADMSLDMITSLIHDNVGASTLLLSQRQKERARALPPLTPHTRLWVLQRKQERSSVGEQSLYHFLKRLYHHVLEYEVTYTEEQRWSGHNSTVAILSLSLMFKLQRDLLEIQLILLILNPQRLYK